MKVLWFIASRYLFFRNKKRAINVLSFITMFAMACGAAALLIILSTFNGFENLSKNLNESFQPDLTIRTKKDKRFHLSQSIESEIEAISGVKTLSKVSEEKVYLKYGSSEALATLKGVDHKFFQTNEIKDFIVAGDSVLESDQYSFGLLGAGIAQKLGINLNNQFEQLAIYYPKAESSGLGLKDNFELSYLTPGGIFSIFQDYDERYIIAPISFVEYLSGDENSYTSLEIKVENGALNSVKKKIESILGEGFDVKTKLELNESFYKISRVEKLVTTFILSFVLIILSFNFIGSLTMHIIEKTEDIKMLHYLGMKRNDIFGLYLSYGLLQGLLGGMMGLIIGILICLGQMQFGFLKMPGSGTFVIQDYPVSIYLSDIASIFGILTLVSILASLYPAWKARESLINLSRDSSLSSFDYNGTKSTAPQSKEWVSP